MPKDPMSPLGIYSPGVRPRAARVEKSTPKSTRNNFPRSAATFIADRDGTVYRADIFYRLHGPHGWETPRATRLQFEPHDSKSCSLCEAAKSKAAYDTASVMLCLVGCLVWGVKYLFFSFN